LVTRGVLLELGSQTIDTDLIILGIEGMDVILGMDWMNQHKVVLDISERVVEINSPIVGAMTLYLPFKDDVNLLCGNHFSAGRNSSGSRVCGCFSR
jgi:hypothetical protein